MYYFMKCGVYNGKATTKAIHIYLHNKDWS